MVIIDELKNLYPFRSHFLKVAHGPNKNKEHRLHYIDEGQGDPVLCLHGNPTWSFFFRDLVKELSKTHRVIALDHMGSGLSDRPQDFSYQLADHIRNVETLVEALQLEKITLIVHDWGGPIGLGLATNKPSRIQRMVSCNTAAFLSKDLPKRIAILRSTPLNKLFIRGANLFSRAALYMASAKGLRPAVKKAYLFPYDSYHNRVGVAGFVRDIPTHRDHPSYKTVQSIEQQLPQLKVPTLLLWGAKDFCFHLGFFKQWQNIYPHSESKILSTAGHYLFEDEPVAAVGTVRAFVDKK